MEHIFRIILLQMWVLLFPIYSAGTSSSQRGGIFFSDGKNKVVHVSDTGSGAVSDTLDVHTTNPMALYYDPQAHQLYISSDNANEILKYDIANRITDKIQLPTRTQIYGLVVDHASDNVFYLDYNHQTVVVVHGLWYRELLCLQDPQLQRITMDARNGSLFWSTTGPGSIMRAEMDGTNRAVVVDHDIYQPFGLYLYDNRLYWCDHWVESCNLDGSDRKKLVNLHSNACSQLVVDETYIYWVDGQNQKIYRVVKDIKMSMPSEEWYTARDRIRGLTPFLQHYISNSTDACAIGKRRCKQLCLKKPSGVICQCADGYELQPDGISCQKLHFNVGLLVSDEGALFAVDVIANKSQRLHSLTSNNNARLNTVAYDPNDEVVIFATDDHIYKICFPKQCHGTERYSRRGAGFRSIAVDPNTHDVYVVASRLNLIIRLLYTGSNEDFVIGDDIKTLALHHTSRMLYWGVKGEICIISMDSKNLEQRLQEKRVFVKTEGVPDKLTIDEKGGKLYWVIKGQHNLYWGQLRDGKTELLLGNEDIIALTSGGGCLFWGIRDKQTIFKWDMSTKKHQNFTSLMLLYMTDIAYFSKTGGNCSNGDALVITTPVTGGRINVLWVVCGVACAVAIGLAILFKCIKCAKAKQEKKENDIQERLSSGTIQPMPVRPIELRPMEAMMSRNLPAVPTAEDSSTPVEAGFRQFAEHPERFKGLSTSSEQVEKGASCCSPGTYVGLRENFSFSDQ